MGVGIINTLFVHLLNVYVCIFVCVEILVSLVLSVTMLKAIYASNLRTRSDGAVPEIIITNGSVF